MMTRRSIIDRAQKREKGPFVRDRDFYDITHAS